MKVKLSFLALVSAVCALAAPPAATPAGARLESAFHNPPVSSRPWVYWWWHNGNMSEASITRDLEEMKAKGVGGVLMFDSRGYHQQYLPPPPPKNEFLDPEWRKLVKFAISEANRLGLQMSMNLSTHAGSLHAPWNMGDNRPKKLVWTSAEVSGPGRISVELPAGTETQAWDVALLAVRRGSTAGGAPAGSTPVTLSGKWREIQTELSAQSGTPVAEVLDLTGKVDSSRRLSWDAPAGEWTLLRFAYVIIPGFDLTVDVLNQKAVENYFQRVAGPILADAGPLAGKALTYFYSVSWEGAAPTWTPGFEAEFQKYRGYSPISRLPVLAGMTVGSREESTRFLADFSRALGDCFLVNCYGKLRELSNKAGIKWHAESGGPWGADRGLFFRQADQLEFWARNDMPQGEFWQPEADNPAPGSTRANTRRTAMAAHVYGRPIVASESFTHMISHWIMYPARLKPNADDIFIDGVNQIIWHTFSASPPEYGKPGIIYWAGTHVNPNVTWWEQSKAFFDYLARCDHMLRQGLPVSDVVVYTSSRNNSIWGHDEKWSPSASLILGKGYKHDVISREALLERLSAKAGRLVLPDGVSYRLLVVDLDEDDVAPEVLAKIESLARAGATVVFGKRRPSVAPGLKGYPGVDEKVRQLAAQLWGDAGDQPFRKPFGQGFLTGGAAMDDILKKEGLLPDFEGPFQFTHRRGAGTDIYFLAGEGSAECTFRVKGREPEFWDAVTGRLRPADSYRTTSDGRIVATVSLPKHGSVFVVFRKPGAPARQAQSVAAKSPAAPIELTGPWNVRFPAGWGAPESESFARLTPWNEHPVEGIKYFSGTATYRKTFELSAAQAKLPARLNLGEVKYIATVRLNGKSLGIVWTDPWTVDLTGAAKAGTNELEVDVTNLWVNRLVGDAALPEAKRFTKTHARREPGVKYPRPRLAGYLATDPLVRSGLMGPVRVEFGK